MAATEQEAPSPQSPRDSTLYAQVNHAHEHGYNIASRRAKWAPISSCPLLQERVLQQRAETKRMVDDTVKASIRPNCTIDLLWNHKLNALQARDDERSAEEVYPYVFSKYNLLVAWHAADLAPDSSIT